MRHAPIVEEDPAVQEWEAVQEIVERIQYAATGVFVALEKGDTRRNGNMFMARLRAALDEADQQFTKWAEG
jgi:hypothetical protein